ncbi:MAG: type II toxin-antitoxin system RelE/ParE family toxin [Acidobacteria bacterium]|nr:type II toxin-antitoxin system RelE/ParE family toxin [Acidobacteriota bacterium]
MIRGFPKEARILLGKAIANLQAGEKLAVPLSRPMPTVGMGVSELRVRCTDGQFRAFCFRASERGVLVFDAFNKKTERTPNRDIAVGKRRLKEMLSA